MDLGEHVPVYVLEPEHLEYHAPSDDDNQVEDQPHADDATPTAESPGYIADSDSMGEDNDEDPELDLSKEHKPEDDDEDAEDDPNEEHEPEDKDTKKVELSKGPDETKPCDVAESSAAATTRAPKGQYDFVDTIEEGHSLIHSPGHDAWTISRAADIVEDVGYVRALQASEHRMMTSIEEVNLRISYQAQVHRQESKCFYTQLHDAQTDCRDIRLVIDVVRGQRNAYETELQEVRQTYLSFKARNRALLARLEILETHISRMEWRCQSVEDLAVTQMMRIHTLEARA
nr:hypothetical protein [Tanacetum cinerariifolium]